MSAEFDWIKQFEIPTREQVDGLRSVDLTRWSFEEVIAVIEQVNIANAALRDAMTDANNALQPAREAARITTGMHAGEYDMWFPVGQSDGVQALDGMFDSDRCRPVMHDHSQDHESFPLSLWTREAKRVQAHVKRTRKAIAAVLTEQ